MNNTAEESALTLSDIWRSISEQLTRAVNDRKHPFRLPVLATIGEEMPNMRIVVLRKFQTTPFILTAYTDIRSQKISEIRKQPQTTWLFWNSCHQIQIRAFGSIQIEHSTLNTQQIWNNMHLGAKATYLALAPPSSSSSVPTNGLPEDYSKDSTENYLPTNFCILHGTIEKVEWLKLDKLEHRRAVFILNKHGEWDKNWLIP